MFLTPYIHAMAIKLKHTDTYSTYFITFRLYRMDSVV